MVLMVYRHRGKYTVTRIIFVQSATRPSDSTGDANVPVDGSSAVRIRVNIHTISFFCLTLLGRGNRESVSE